MRFRSRSFLYFLCLASLITRAEVSNNIDFSARSRLASVDTGDSAQDASILLRLTLNSAWAENITSKIEVDHVSSFMEGRRSDGLHFNDNPLIPDVPGTEINQAFIAIAGDDMSVKLGRQRLNFDSQRFVGGNGFWQNEQTFDAIHSSFHLQSNSTFTYTYVFNVDRIYGDDADAHLYPEDTNYAANDGLRPGNFLGDHRHDTHLFHLEWNEWDYTQLIGYGYFIDNKTLPSSSNNTLGLSYNFNYKSDVFKYRVQLESAAQKRPEIADAPIVPYYLLDAGIALNSVELSSRYEILASKNAVTFITPLASGYDFQGWANNFSQLPAQGIKDASLRLLWRSAPFRIDLRYHIFTEYTGDNMYGKETDVEFIYKPLKKHSIAVRFAWFQPNNNAVQHTADTQKLFVDYSYNL